MNENWDEHSAKTQITGAIPQVQSKFNQVKQETKPFNKAGNEKKMKLMVEKRANLEKSKNGNPVAIALYSNIIWATNFQKRGWSEKSPKQSTIAITRRPILPKMHQGSKLVTVLEIFTWITVGLEVKIFQQVSCI